MYSVLAAADTAQGGDAMILTAALAFASAITGAIVAAVAGFCAWKRQKEVSAGNALLGAAYSIKGAITRVRKEESFSWSRRREAQKEGNLETPSGSRGGLGPDERSKLESAYREEWSWVQDALLELYTPEAEAEVYWGGRVQEELQSLRECAWQLRFALRQYFEHQIKEGPLKREKLERLESIVWEPADDEVDEFGLEVEEAVERVRQLVRRHIRMRPGKLLARQQQP